MSTLWRPGDPIMCWLCPNPQGIASLTHDVYECSRGHRIPLADVTARAEREPYTDDDVAWLRGQARLAQS